MQQKWVLGLAVAVIVVGGFLWWLMPAAQQSSPMSNVTVASHSATSVQTNNQATLPVVQPAKIETPIVPLTPVAKKVEKEVEHTPMNRPMNMVIKNWLACQSKDLYNSTETLLEHQSPDASAVFQGSSPQCIMLVQGKKVTVLQKNNADSSVEIQQEGSTGSWWTNASALADDKALAQ